MQYLLQILHLSCQVQRLPGYQAPWSVLLRNRMAERFASVSEDELCRLIKEKDSKNTKRATKASVKVLNEYLQEKNLDKPHHDDKVTLANVLKRFYAEARKKNDGSPYSKSNNNNNNNNFIYIALKSNNCPKRYLITKKNIYIYKKNLNYKISTI